MLLHAYPVAEDGATRVGTGGVNCDDSDALALFAIEAGQLIRQRAFARPWRPGEAENVCMTAVGEDRLQKLRPARTAVFNHADSAGQRARITCAQLLNPGLDFRIQTAQCKAGAGQDGTSKDWTWV